MNVALHDQTIGQDYAFFGCTNEIKKLWVSKMNNYQPSALRRITLLIIFNLCLVSCGGGGDTTTIPPETVTSGIGIGTGTGIPTGTGTAIISGRVSGETSNLPLQGAVVKVYYASDIDPSNNSVLTDVNGRYNLTVNENVDLSLQFSATDYATINSERGQIVGNVSGADLPMSTTTEAQQMIDAIFAGPDYRSYGWVLVNTEASDGSELLGVTINSSVAPDPSRNPNTRLETLTLFT